jgi:predicted site-specific integrase-resolvase
MSNASTILNDDRAAEILGTTPRRVRAWVRHGKIPGHFLPNGSAVIVLADLLRWLKQAPITTTKEATHAS